MILILVILFFLLLNSRENFGNYKYGQNTCPYKMTKIIKEMLDKNDFKKGENWTLYIPCYMNNLSKELKTLKPTNTEQKIYMITGQINMINKNLLWKRFYQKFGNVAVKYMPNSYLLYNKKDRLRFHDEYIYKKKYILKKNIQNQMGLFLTDKKREIINAKDYVIAQEFLLDPYLINNRKINLRIYLLIVCQNGLKAYYHQNGFIYYTNKEYNENILDKEYLITTGDVDRKVYQDNPMSLKYLKNKKIKKNIHKIMKVLVNVFKPYLCQSKKYKNYLTFQLFGVDLFVHSDSSVKIMEVNKGPSLTPKDKQDRSIKEEVVGDMFNLVLGKKHKFIQIE